MTSRCHGRRPIPENIPQKIVLHELPEDQRRCPTDGAVMQPIRWEESRQLDFTPAQVVLLIHRRAVYACPTKHDEATLLMAPKPPQPIEKGLPTAGMLAQIVVSKFGDHLPGYRQEDIFSRLGIVIQRSTIYDWLAAAADLVQPLYDLMKLQVLQSHIIHTDDTKVQMLNPKLTETVTARFWAYLGDSEHPYTVYDFTEDRTRDGPAKFLEGFIGYLQADAYSAYDGIYLGSQKTIIEVACWAHCRRYWYKARESAPEPAHRALAFISQLYQIEEACKDFDATTRFQMRQQHAAPLLADFEAWLQQQTFLPKSLIGQAATYTRNQWQALQRYLDNGDLSIDNNAAERAQRPIAIGRKNWLFVGSPTAGHRAAVLISLMATCKRNHVEPWAYFQDLFTQLASNPGEELLPTLLPDYWLKTHPQHRWTIADLRKQERDRKNNS